MLGEQHIRLSQSLSDVGSDVGHLASRSWPRKAQESGPQTGGSDAALPDDSLQSRELVKCGLGQTHLALSPLLLPG